MRQYVGNQFQDNALLQTGSFNPAAVNVGTYCALSAGNNVVNFGVTPQPYFSQFSFICTTFYVFANAGVTGGSIQPQIQCADGVYRDYGPPITPTVPGFVSSFAVPTPVLGARFNITNAITGGSVFLEIDCLMG
jgi:hypothetical protein